MTSSETSILRLVSDKRHPSSDPELPHSSSQPGLASTSNAAHTVTGATGDIKDEGASKNSNDRQNGEEREKTLHRCQGVLDFSMAVSGKSEITSSKENVE